MPNYNAVGLLTKPLHTAEMGNAVGYDDTVTTTAALLNGDKVRLLRVPAGTRLYRLSITNPDLDTGTTLQGKLGFEYADGTAGDDDYFAVAGALWQAAGRNSYTPLVEPVTLEKDAFIIATITANGATNVGSIFSIAEGIFVGVK